MPEYGPFATERDARATDACAAERAAWDANPVPGEDAKWNMRMLLSACEEIGLELGAYDLSPLRQVAMYETSKCVALRGIIRRAFEAGKAAGPDGAVTQWGISLCDAASLPAGPVQRHRDEGEARRALREAGALGMAPPGTVVSRQAQAGPWLPVPGVEEGNG